MYILILTLLFSNGAAVTSFEVNNLETCESVGKAWADRVYAKEYQKRRRLSTLFQCIKK